MILWDHQHFTRSLGSRSLSYCMCYIVLRKNGQGVTRSCRSCLCCTCRAKLTFTSHACHMASTMGHTRGNHDHFKSTQSTHATQNNDNILAAGMHNPCKAAQLNHIDRYDRTSSCIHFPYSPHRDHALWRNILGM